MKYFLAFKKWCATFFSRKKKKPLSKILYVSRPARLDRFRKLPFFRVLRHSCMRLHKRLSMWMSPRILYVSASVGLSVLIIGFLFFSNFFVVGNIVVVRNSPFLPSSEIEKSLQGQLEKNIFFVNTKGLEEALKKEFPFMKTVAVEKVFPRVLQVRADSYDIIGTIMSKEDKNIYLLAENGTVVQNADVNTGTQVATGSLLSVEVPKYTYDLSKAQVIDPKVKVVPGRQFIGKAHMDALRQLMLLLDKNFPLKITKIMYLPLEEEVHVLTDKDVVLLFWLQESIETQVFKLKWKLEEPTISLMGGNISYVDVRIKDRVDICEKTEPCAEYYKSMFKK